jgi:hypothetical protein
MSLTLDGFFLSLPLQIVFQRMKHVRKLAEDHGWQVTQEMPHPLQSSTVAKLQNGYSEMTSLLLESKDRRSKVELVLSWDDLNVGVARLVKQAAGSGGVAVGTDKWEIKHLQLQDMSGANFKEKITSLFTGNYNH